VEQHELVQSIVM